MILLKYMRTMLKVVYRFLLYSVTFRFAIGIILTASFKNKKRRWLSPFFVLVESARFSVAFILL